MSGARARSGKGSSRGRPSPRPPARGAAKAPAKGPTKAAGAPGSRKQPSTPPRVGKHPSNPTFLLAVALAWLAAGVFSWFGLHTSWKLIPTICFAGVGLLYLRGAAGAYMRRSGPAPTAKK